MNGSHVITQRRPSRHSLFDIVLHLNPISHALTHAKIACPCKQGFRIKCTYEKCMPSGNPIGKYSKCLYDQRDIKYSYYGCGSPYFS